MKHNPPCVNTDFPELHASYPEAWAYMHVLNQKTSHLFTYGLDLDTLEWNGCVDDTLEDQVNGESEVEEITDGEAIMADHLADVALETFKKLKDSLLFQDFGGQAFSVNLLPNRVLHSAVLSFEYER